MNVDEENRQSDADFDSFGFGEPYKAKHDVAKPTRPSGDEPWLNWGGTHIHPRGGVEAATLRHTGWLVEEVTGYRPRSDRAWARWRPFYEHFYKEAEGDFDVIEEAVENKWNVPEQYQTLNPDRILEEISKLMARSEQKAEDAYEIDFDW